MRRSVRTGAVLTMAFALATSVAVAQDDGFQVKLGGFFPQGGGEFWEETEEVFTLDPSDFRDGVLGFTYLAGVNNWTEVGFNLDFYRSSVVSADRRTPDFGPIVAEHDTTLRMVPVSFDVRVLPAGRYRLRGDRDQYRVRRPVPYLGGGIGMLFYSYEEEGFFVFEFEDDLGPFTEAQFDRFKDSGTMFTYHAVAGIELPLTKNVGVNFEGKYQWASRDMGDDFQGFGELVLDGMTVSVGASFRF